MALNGKKVGLPAIAAIAMSIVIPVGTAEATNIVPCGSGNEFLNITVHPINDSSYEQCYANAGVHGVLSKWPSGGRMWLERFWTGNNRVQWYGDGRWQPENPVDKWVLFSFPNHPGGVKIEAIRIL
ncbi:hypothetical protein [Amycolatopsis sp. cmx-4-54]|uniref:hypothetical protein n=1 Tax=Amycolatopsis sp. cmx-4-54 TaxID=2790936 RepID=UPI00397A9C6B